MLAHVVAQRVAESLFGHHFLVVERSAQRGDGAVVALAVVVGLAKVQVGQLHHGAQVLGRTAAHDVVGV